MNGRPWTKDELDTLTRMYPDHFAKEIGAVLGRGTASVYEKAAMLGLRSTPEKIRRSGLLSASNPNVIASRFKKGHTPPNKGKRMPPEVYEKVSRTMFKRGHRPVNHREVGSERVNVYGYIEVKVAEPNKWRLKHRVIWEESNGPIPEGHNIQFKNRNPLDCRLENLYILSRAEQMGRENSYHCRYPAEIRELIHLKGVVNRAIHKAEKNRNGEQ